MFRMASHGYKARTRPTLSILFCNGYGLIIPRHCWVLGRVSFTHEPRNRAGQGGRSENGWARRLIHAAGMMRGHAGRDGDLSLGEVT